MLHAQGGIMRAGASRANATTALVFVAIAGVHYGAAPDSGTQKVFADTLSITEQDGETPNTCTFTASGFQPTDGQDVVMTVGSKNNYERLFAGTILNDAHGFVGTPANGNDVVNVIDYGWQLTRRTLSQRWQSTSATVIARAIIAQAPGFTSIRVEEGLPVLDEFTVTNQTLAAALSALAARGGWYWKATYLKDVRFGSAVDASQTDPTPLTLASAVLTDMEGFTVTRDLGSVITRQPVEGGGGNAAGDVSPGDTTIPVDVASWYNPAGGLVVSGPQRIAYGTVWPGGTPHSAPVVAPSPGTGVELGLHQYAGTFVTAAGESLPGPIGSVTLAAVSSPAAAPIVNVFAGYGIPAGTYDYGYTDVAGSGETAVSPVASGVVVHLASPPPSAPGNGVVDGGGLPAGVYQYATTITTPTGESAPGPRFTATAYDVPTAAAPVVATVGTPSADTFKFQCVWRYVFGGGGGGSPSAVSALVAMGSGGIDLTAPAWPGDPADAGLYQLFVYVTVRGGAGALYNLGPFPGTPITPGSTMRLSPPMYWTDVEIASFGAAPSGAVAIRTPVIGIVSAPAYATGQKLYRTPVGSAQLKFLANIPTAGYFYGNDGTPDASLGANAPSVGTATIEAPYLYISAPSVPGATARRIYRTVNGGSQLKLAATLAATANYFADTVLDGALGVNAPTVNTATLARVALSFGLGPAGTTSRKIYRTPIGSTQLKLQQTIANNTVLAGVIDSTPDASLGANAPTSDTSALSNTGATLTSGATSIGAVVLNLASAVNLRTAGGWVLVGTMPVRYAGITSNQLTGIPAFGPGAITAAIPSATPVAALAMLTGIPTSGLGAILYPIKTGDAVNLRIIADDLVAQAALAVLMLPTIDDGVIEGPLIQDGRVSETEARAMGAATLALQSQIAVTVAYTTRDRNTRPPRTIAINLPWPTNVVASFKVLNVGISGFTPALWPVRTVTASSYRFTLQDWLRQLGG